MLRAVGFFIAIFTKKWLEIRDWGLGVTGGWDFSGIVIPSAALDLYCTAGISVYAPRKNNVLVLPHIRR